MNGAQHSVPFFPFKFETYQDVKNNLVFWTVLLLYVTAWLAYYLVLPPGHRRLLRGALWLQHIEIVASVTAISIVIIWLFQLHDAVYDKYVVRWRQTYDTEFILPQLCAPFKTNLDQRFFEVAADNRDQFMEQLFYPYVRDRDTKIQKNTLVRFYERITNYWITQIFEVLLLLTLLLAVAYLPLYRTMSLPWKDPIVSILVLTLALAVNSFLAEKARAAVEKSTRDEIREIHDSFESDLEKRVSKISGDFSLRYGSTAPHN